MKNLIVLCTWQTSKVCHEFLLVDALFKRKMCNFFNMQKYDLCHTESISEVD